MATPPIRIPLVVDDRTIEGLNSAQSRVIFFQKTVEQAGAGMENSMGRGRASAALLSEELGVTIPRHLRTILAQSELIGPALSAALPIVAAIGFFEIASKIPDAIRRATDAIAGFGEEAKKTYNETVESNKKLADSYDALGKKIAEDALVGLSGAAEKQARLTIALKQQTDEEAKLNKVLSDRATLQKAAKATVPKGQGDIFVAAPTEGAVYAKDLLNKRNFDKEVADQRLKLAEATEGVTHAQIELNASLRDDAVKNSAKVAADEAQAWEKFGTVLKEISAITTIAAKEGLDPVAKALFDYNKQLQDFANIQDKINTTVAEGVKREIALRDVEQARGVALQGLSKTLDEILPKLREEADKVVFPKETDKKKLEQMNLGILPSALPTFVQLGQVSKVTEAIDLLHNSFSSTFKDLNIFFATNGNMAQAWSRAILGALEKVVAEMIYTYVISQLLNGLFFRLQGGLDLTAATAAQHSALTPPSLSFGSGPALPNFGGVINAVSPLTGSGFRSSINTAGRSGGGPSAVHVSVHNESSQPVQVVGAHPQVTPEGIVIGVILRDLENGGQLHQAFKSMR